MLRGYFEQRCSVVAAVKPAPTQHGAKQGLDLGHQRKPRTAISKSALPSKPVTGIQFAYGTGDIGMLPPAKAQWV
jgi:hypothetical protein